MKLRIVETQTKNGAIRKVEKRKYLFFWVDAALERIGGNNAGFFPFQLEYHSQEFHKIADHAEELQAMLFKKNKKIIETFNL